MHDPIVSLIRFYYWASMFVLAGFFLLLALIAPKKIKLLFASISGIIVVLYVSFYSLLILSAIQHEKEQAPIIAERQAKYEAAKAVFDEQCKKAGEKIYRTVDNVDGVMLLKVRGKEKDEINRTIWDLAADPMWKSAAIADIESSDGGYIVNFLGSDRKKYSFVDVLKEDGSISRYWQYKGHGDIDEERDGVIKNPSDPARYAVTYENNVDPELRKHWVAGTTIKIIDRQTDELLAEKTIFSFESALGSKATGRMPWLHRPEHCPELEVRYPTAFFTFQVLKPTQFFNSSFNGDQK